jgi:hypothetical protein
VTKLHVATSGDLTRELVKATTDSIREYANLHAIRQAAFIATDKESAAKHAVCDVVEHLDDHLQVAIATVLATFGITTDGEAVKS